MQFEAVVKEIIQRTPNDISLRFNRPEEFN
jgi:hypothetical protein